LGASITVVKSIKEPHPNEVLFRGEKVREIKEKAFQ
jgi:hypothetical protein